MGKQERAPKESLRSVGAIADALTTSTLNPPFPGSRVRHVPLGVMLLMLDSSALRPFEIPSCLNSVQAAPRLAVAQMLEGFFPLDAHSRRYRLISV